MKEKLKFTKTETFIWGYMFLFVGFSYIINDQFLRNIMGITSFIFAIITFWTLIQKKK